MRVRLREVVVAIVLLFPMAALPQDYPNRFVTIVVGFAAGGAADLIARTLSTELSKNLGQQVIVENRPGAGGTIGADFVARAAPNGYTVFLGGPGPNAIAYSLFPNLPYQPKAFTPVTLVSENPNVLAVNSSVPANSVAEFVALARSRPGKLTFGSAGNGSSQHLAAELLKSISAIYAVHIPYRGVPDGINAVVSGEIDFMFPPIFNAVPLMKSGKIKVLGVTTTKRSPILPDVPTIAEAGVPGYDQTVWNALFAPAGTPAPIVDRLHSATVAALKSPDLMGKLQSVGATPASSTPAELAKYIQQEIEKWNILIKRSGAKPG